MKRKVIINADDFGLTYSVNRGVIDVFNTGNLTSASLMVNMTGTADAVKLAKENSKLAVGLHFCITEGKPLSRCTSLTDKNGFFYSPYTLMSRIIRRQVKGSDINMELKAQLEKFKKFDIPLSHIDSHKHLHIIPFITKIMLSTLNQEKCPVRTIDPVQIQMSLVTRRPVKFLKLLARRHFSNQFKRTFAGKTNDKFATIHDLKKFEVRAETYCRLLNWANLEHIIELMVHPYILGEDVFKLYDAQIDTKMPFLKKCEAEYGQLTREKFFDETAYDLITYEKI